MNSNYSFSKYVYFSRWVSYWHQIEEALNLKPNSVLIVGIGDGIAADVLKKHVPKVKTLDLDGKLKPDISASVENTSLADESFDLVLCAEVLEHLPFEKFEKSLAELRRISKKYVVLSLPHFGPQIKFSFKVPFVREIKIALKIPFLKKHEAGGEHFWEIGRKGCSASKAREIIRKYFKIKKEFIPFENQYHHFFVLQK